MAHIPFNIKEATDTQLALAHDTAAFTNSQRTIMSAAVSAVVKAKGVASESSLSSLSCTAASSRKGQSFLFIHNYLPKKRWDLYCDSGVPWDAKMEDACDFLLKSGCPFPNDDTSRVFLVILQACSKKVTDPDSNYDDLHKFRGKLVEKRKILGVTKTMQDFQRHPD